MERAFFFDSLNGDRTYKADDFTSYFDDLVVDGVFKDEKEMNLKVQAYSGMRVRVTKGSAIIKGYRYVNDGNLDLTLDNSDATNNRIDLIVLRLDIANRTLNTVVKKGVPGTVPQEPSLINTTSTVELALASILINKGTVSIDNANVTDKRVFAYSYLDVNHIHKEGHNSGSDADMLDGKHASYFMPNSRDNEFVKTVDTGSVGKTAKRITDLSRAYDTGFYAFGRDAVGGPGGVDYGVLQHFKWDIYDWYQLIITDKNKRFTRVYINGIFSSWVEM